MGRIFDTEHWKVLGKTYVADFPGGPAYVAQVDALRAVLADIPTPTRILEIGCGFGRITKVLRETFPGAAILATDSSEAMLQSADDVLAADHVATGIFDLNIDTPITPAADLVVAAEVLMHREPGDQIASDVAKLVAMTGGTLITVDWYEPGVADMPGNYQHNMIGLVSDAAAARNFTARLVEVPAARQAIHEFTFVDANAPTDTPE